MNGKVRATQARSSLALPVSHPQSNPLDTNAHRRGVALTTRRAGLYPDVNRAGKDVISACPYRKTNIDDPDEYSSTLAGAL